MTSEQLRNELREALKEQSKESKAGKYKTIVMTVITILTVFAAIIGSWSTNKAAVAQNLKDISSQQEVVKNHTTEIENIKLKALEKSTILDHVKQQVDEIKNKVGGIENKVNEMDKKLDRALK